MLFGRFETYRIVRWLHAALSIHVAPVHKIDPNVFMLMHNLYYG